MAALDPCSLLAAPAGAAGRQVRHVRGSRQVPGGRGLLFPGRVTLSRSWGISIAATSSKGGPSDGQALPPYSDMLLQREYELWQRQSGLYDQLLEQQERDRQLWAAERERWMQQETSLKQEVAELRAQLLYVLSRVNSGGGAADAHSSTSSSASFAQQAAPLPGKEPARLPLETPGMSPSEQVQAVVDAFKLDSARTGTPEIASAAAVQSSSSSVAGGLAMNESQALPRYAAELAAAVAAVEELDVLSDDLDFGALATRLAGNGPAPAQREAAAAAPPLPSATAAVSPPQQQQPQASSPPPAAAAAPANPPGPRPALVAGSDDIYWVSQLHTALMEAGFYPGDDDLEDFFFGDSTLSAVLTAQACEGLPETGVVDEALWQVLLGDAAEMQPSQGAAAGAFESPKPYQELFSQASAGTMGSASPLAAAPVHAVHEVTITDSVESAQTRTYGVTTQETVIMHEEVHTVRGSSARTEWPVLMEGDGGKEVHALQTALTQQGYYPSDDDMRWWQFGDSTLSALKYFQACSGLAESGVVDPPTWKALLGADATPADLDSVRSEDSADEDMAQEGRVWLMVEQRWEDPNRMARKRQEGRQ